MEEEDSFPLLNERKRFYSLFLSKQKKDFLPFLGEGRRFSSSLKGERRLFVFFKEVECFLPLFEEKRRISRCLQRRKKAFFLSRRGSLRQQN